jgi:hypothetical protein
MVVSDAHTLYYRSPDTGDGTRILVSVTVDDGLQGTQYVTCRTSTSGLSRAVAEWHCTARARCLVPNIYCLMPTRTAVERHTGTPKRGPGLRV